MLLSTLLSCATIAVVVAAPTPNAPSVTTSQGTWIGERERRVESFRGIPFAQPPVGNLRFAPPVAATKNFGVNDATVSHRIPLSLGLSLIHPIDMIELRLLLSSSQRPCRSESFPSLCSLVLANTTIELSLTARGATIGRTRCSRSSRRRRIRTHSIAPLHFCFSRWKPKRGLFDYQCSTTCQHQSWRQASRHVLGTSSLSPRNRLANIDAKLIR